MTLNALSMNTDEPEANQTLITQEMTTFSSSARINSLALGSGEEQLPLVA